MSDDKTLLSRRTVLKGSGASLGAAAVGLGGLAYSSQPALAVDNTIAAADLSINENANEITEVNFTPDDLTFDWSDFSSGVSDFDITIDVRPGDSSDDADYESVFALTNISDDNDDPVTSFTGDELTNTSGTVTVSLEERGLTAETTYDATATDFDFPSGVSDGESDNVDVDLRVTVTANNAGDGGPAEDVDETTFNVELTNPNNTSTSDGEVSTTGDTS